MTPSLSEIKAAIRRLRASLDQIEAYVIPPEGELVLGAPALIRGHVEEILPNEYRMRLDADRMTASVMVDRINVMKPAV